MAQALAGSAAMLGGCGQKGDLYLPDSPESRARATLPQSLNPWHTPAAPASGSPAQAQPAPAEPAASVPAR
jgi:predicted small lipoprotein YifL